MRKNWLKITKIFLLLGFALVASSCQETGCIEAEELNNRTIKVESNPINDGVTGTYNHSTGGQSAQWHETGLMTSNEEFVILVSGGWQPWQGSLSGIESLEKMPRCKICSKKTTSLSENCICGKDETPMPEDGLNGNPATSDCSGINQDNPNLCSCTTNNGARTDYGVYHFPLNFYDKGHGEKLPDEQSDICKYDRGLGLYLGVFGRNSNTVPTRLYHLFSEEEVCAITRNSKNECIDEEGKSRLKYIFRSKNAKNFVKDDKAENDGLDTNSGDDEYHKAREFVKLIIYDSYYSDNYGHYNVEFVKGVFDESETGLLQFLVALVEDQMLGEFNENGEREGGILEFMYNAITQDTYFIAIFQMCLIIYVTIFGLSSLLGLVELNKKEIYSRILKVGVIIFFVSPSSWIFYKDIVVEFFVNGAAVIVEIVTQINELALDEETNPILIAQGNNGNPDSVAGRFAYIDELIRTMFSATVTKKIWGLFFAQFFGFIYIILIYLLIGYFIYTMLVAATVFCVTLMKLLFGLALGPFFIALALFKITNEMFKKWIGFLGARSLEMLILFLLLYTFVMLIDKKFNEILHYPVCAEMFGIGFFKFKVLKASIDRSVVEWFSMLATLGLFIFMSDTILSQIPALSGALVSINGVGNSDGGGSYASQGFGLGRQMISDAFKAGSNVASKVIKRGGGAAFRATRSASRASGLSGKIDSAFSKVPFRSPRRMLADNIVDQAIKKGKREAARKGLTGADFDKAVRNFALNDKQFGIYSQKHKAPNKAALYDLTDRNIAARLNKKLVQDPLKKYLKKQAKKLKKLDSDKIPLGKEMSRQLKEDARKWAGKNLVGGADAINPHLKNMQKFIQDQGALTTKQAVKRFGDDDGLRDKYLMHLKNRQFDKRDEKKLKHRLFGKKDVTSDPNSVKRFLRRSQIANSNYDAMNQEKFAKDTSLAMTNASRDYLSGAKMQAEKERINEFYNDKIKDAKSRRVNKDQEGIEERALLKKRNKKFQELEDKRNFHKQFLKDQIRKQFNELEKDPETLQKARDVSLIEIERLRKLHAKKTQELVFDKDWKETARINGGIQAYGDGFVDLDGKTLFEAQMLHEMLHPSGEGVEGANRAYEDAQKAIEDLEIAQKLQQEEIEKANAALEEAIKNNDLESAQAAQNLLPQEMDLEFGQTIEDALSLQVADVGLKAGNIGLAQAQDTTEINKALLASCEAAKTQVENKRQVKNFEKKLMEHQIATLEKSANPDANQVASLKSKLSDIEHEISNCDSKIETVKSQINDIKIGVV